MKPEDLQPENQTGEDTPVWQALRHTSDLPEALRMLDIENEPVLIERDGAPVGVMVPLDVFERLVEGVKNLIAKDLSDIEDRKEALTEGATPSAKPAWQQVKTILDEAKKALGDLGKK